MKTQDTTLAVLPFNAFLTKTYGWMMAGLIVSAVFAFVVANSPAIAMLVLATPLLYVLLLIEVLIVFALQPMLKKISASTATLWFLIYAALNGATLSSILFVYEAGSIVSAFAITAGTFGAMSLIGMQTKRDLSGLGRFFLMTLIGLLIAMIVNLFLKNSGFDFAISIIAVLLFSGLTAYDTQKLKALATADMNEEASQKAAIIGALTLYLDFVNLFLHILRLLRGSK